ncbi:glycerophosphodiester phosphodiesterase [Candidatus Wolfebacteria bacterium]|nr:glycerophosphodiester phosphodiesterase [Candidatus Wolfebacteria bacterium]
MRRKLIIAHRGASKYAPENTIEAFQKAIDMGADMIELDVRKTRDGVLVVHHDENISGVPIKDLTFNEIENRREKQETALLTLEDVLKFASGKIKLDIEAKEAGYEKELAQSILKYFNPEDFIITSFNANLIKAIKSFYPDIKTGQIIAPRNIVEADGIFNEANSDFLILYWEIFKTELFEKMRQKPTFVWTVNDEKVIEEFMNDDRVAGIITDAPDVAIKIRDGKA